MAAVEHFHPETDIHPIDIVETLAEAAEWEFDRVGEDQIAVAVAGAWRTYSLSLIWSHHDDMLRLILSFESSPPDARMAEFYRLLNQRQALGRQLHALAGRCSPTARA